MFDTTTAPLPVKTLTRFYLRLAQQVKSAEDRLGPTAENPADRVLAQLLEREAGR